MWLFSEADWIAITECVYSATGVEQGWINMVPDDVIFMFASFCVLVGCFFFVALLWFLIMPQSVLEIEIIKQAGIETYTRTFEMPVGDAYKMYDGIMKAKCIEDDN